MVDTLTLALIGGLGLLAYAGSSSGSASPDDSGDLGFGEPGDGEIWDRVVDGGDPLFGLGIDEAAVRDPRRVEALMQQRVLRPLRLAIARMTRPDLSIAEIDLAMKRSWLRRNAAIRSRCGSVPVGPIADAWRDSWISDSRTLGHLVAGGGPLSSVFVAAVRSNADDIRAAFEESGRICRAAAEFDPANGSSWCLMCCTLDAASSTLESILVPGSAPNDTVPIDLVSDEDGDRMGAVTMGAISFDDSYGLVLDPGPSLDDDDDDDLDDEDFGLAAADDDDGDDDDALLDPAYAEYLVSGHRAPTVGLGDYRRSGGRFFGGRS